MELQEYMTLNKLYKRQPTEEDIPLLITMTRAREFLMATGTNKMAGTKKIIKHAARLF